MIDWFNPKRNSVLNVKGNMCDEINYVLVRYVFFYFFSYYLNSFSNTGKLNETSLLG